MEAIQVSFNSLTVIPFCAISAVLTSVVCLDFSSCWEAEVVKNHYVVETLPGCSLIDAAEKGQAWRMAAASPVYRCIDR